VNVATLPKIKHGITDIEKEEPTIDTYEDDLELQTELITSTSITPSKIKSDISDHNNRGI
jgi:hypothetical protein